MLSSFISTDLWWRCNVFKFVICDFCTLQMLCSEEGKMMMITQFFTEAFNTSTFHNLVIHCNKLQASVLLEFTLYSYFKMQVENKLIGRKPGTAHYRSASADRRRRSLSPSGFCQLVHSDRRKCLFVCLLNCSFIVIREVIIIVIINDIYTVQVCTTPQMYWIELHVKQKRPQSIPIHIQRKAQSS